MYGCDRWLYIEVMTCSSQISWPLSLFSTANETFLLCLVLFSLHCIDLSQIRFYSVLISFDSFKIPPPPTYATHARTHAQLSHQQQCHHQQQTIPLQCIAADGWGWKNRRQINWIIKNMQMNSFQFKCRFWHFSAVMRRMLERGGERKRDWVKLPPKKCNQQQFYPYLYSNQLFVYRF